MPVCDIYNCLKMLYIAQMYVMDSAVLIWSTAQHLKRKERKECLLVLSQWGNIQTHLISKRGIQYSISNVCYYGNAFWDQEMQSSQPYSSNCLHITIADSFSH